MSKDHLCLRLHIDVHTLRHDLRARGVTVGEILELAALAFPMVIMVSDKKYRSVQPLGLQSFRFDTWKLMQRGLSGCW